jgi:hypothetical protein
MDTQEAYRIPRTPSAVDLTRLPTGLASSVPPSPSLNPLGYQNTTTRRRASWSRMDSGEAPFQLEPPRFPVHMDRHTPDMGSTTTAGYDDPFYFPVDDPSSHRRQPYSGANYDSDPDSNSYSTSQAGPSSASLLRIETNRDDDEARLMSNMASIGMTGGWGDVDSERIAGTSPSARRRQYNGPPSPLKKSGSFLMSVSRKIQRASLRVVDLASSGLETQVRLADDDDDDDSKVAPVPDGDEASVESRNLRGRALGFLGPSNKLRLACFHLLVHR